MSNGVIFGTAVSISRKQPFLYRMADSVKVALPDISLAILHLPQYNVGRQSGSACMDGMRHLAVSIPSWLFLLSEIRCRGLRPGRIIRRGKQAERQHTDRCRIGINVRN